LSDNDCFDLNQTITDIATLVNARVEQVRSAVNLLEEGNTLPFIARYRKEATAGLDEIALRAIEDALAAAKELAKRKTTILKTLSEQGNLTEDLKATLLACDNKHDLEVLYLPFKPKKRTRATKAREIGLQPLADILLKQETLGRPKRDVLAEFVEPRGQAPDAEAALQGACDIVAETWADEPAVRKRLLDEALSFGEITSVVKRGKKDVESKFSAYFDHRERLSRAPSHRFLAMKRGEAEGVLRIGIELDDAVMLRRLKSDWLEDASFEFHADLVRTAEDAYQRLLIPATQSAALAQKKEQADLEAISVFASNLRELLLAPPAGAQPTIGIDPGFRTGCKVAVVDAAGKFLASATIYPTPPKSATEESGDILLKLIERHNVKLIAIGNGTASRETDAFVSQLIKENSLEIVKAQVSESGASIYSASETAIAEYPDLDLTVRGAISIAHRLQDPLAELVKLDPKSIGVGQYQHDVNQPRLQQALDREVEHCVNSVGVDLNTASGSLLSYVAGIGPKLAANIVKHRDDNTRFRTRRDLLKVPKLGAKAFEQAAGFLRIRDAEQPLDNSAVHPESYYIVEKMAKQLNVATAQLVGNTTLATKLSAAEFVDDRCGELTVKDILAEVAKPGRDPRKEFKTAKFADNVNEISDLSEGMILEGVVTNVTKFGAFVDIGVHQDGLVHISQLANQYIADPSEVVAVGDICRVKVMEIDEARKRISLSRKAV